MWLYSETGLFKKWWDSEPITWGPNLTGLGSYQKRKKPQRWYEDTKKRWHLQTSKSLSRHKSHQPHDLSPRLQNCEKIILSFQTSRLKYFSQQLRWLTQQVWMNKWPLPPVTKNKKKTHLSSSKANSNNRTELASIWHNNIISGNSINISSSNEFIRKRF